MQVKTQYFLQPQAVQAHSLIVENSTGQIIFAALEASDGSVLAAQAGDPDFAGILQTLNVEKTTTVYAVVPKSIEAMKALF
jgi:hypothetical protein